MNPTVLIDSMKEQQIKPYLIDSLYIYIYIRKHTHTHTHTHIYIYSHLQTDLFSFYQKLISVARQTSFPVAGIETRLTKTPIQASSPQPRWNPVCSEVNFKTVYESQFTIVYIHPLNGYRDLNSYMKRLAIKRDYFIRLEKLNPTGVGGYISI